MEAGDSAGRGAQAAAAEYWTARRFMAERPDYVATPKERQRIEEYMRAAKLDTTNVDHVHQAAKALEARGLLHWTWTKSP